MYPNKSTGFFNPRNRVLLFLAFVFFALIAVYLWVVPAIAERMVSAVPVSYEKEIGARLYASMAPQLKADREKTRLMKEFYDRLRFDSVYRAKVTVVDSPEKNAFAMPGGYIVVYSGILEGMRSWESLAALLAHETAHITHRHTLRTLMRGMGRTVMLSILTGGDGIMAAVLGRADELKGLQYSRALETEADNEGIALLKQRNINPDGMLKLMDYLRTESEGVEPVSFLSTHPVFETRMANIRKQMKGGVESGEAPELERLFAALKGGGHSW